MAKDQGQVLDKLFTQGLVKNLWENKTPDHYADIMTNLRIKNWWITARKGTKTLFIDNNSTPIQGITSNSVNNTLLVVQDGHLRKINIWADPVDDTDIGDISHTWKVRFINYGKYTIILTGIWYPRVYDNTTLSQLTSTNLAVNTNSSFGSRYAGFTVVNSNLDKNIITVSRPITLANQEYAYDWVWSNSETLTFWWEVMGMISTLQFLWIFTSETIEYIGRDNLTTTGGIASLFSIPISKGDIVMNPDCITGANEFIFYLTKGKKIKTINYREGNPTPQVAVISDAIDEFMQNNLHDDQSSAFSVYDQQENLVKFYVRTKDSTVNNLCIVRDMEHLTFFFDMDKYYIWVVELWEKYYAGSPYIYRVLQDEVGTDDDDYAVNRRFESSKITLGNPVMQKNWRGHRLAGKINMDAIINREFAVENKVVMSKVIDSSTIPWNIGSGSLWIGWAEIWWEPIWWNIVEETEDMLWFDKEANIWAIRDTGKRAKIIVYGGNQKQKFIIDYADITFRMKMRADRLNIV